MARSTTDTKSLRSAAKNPFGWDVSGLLEDAAAELDAMQATIDVLLFEFGTNEPELLKETIANTRKAKREAYADKRRVHRRPMCEYEGTRSKRGNGRRATEEAGVARARRGARGDAHPLTKNRKPDTVSD